MELFKIGSTAEICRKNDPFVKYTLTFITSCHNEKVTLLNEL